MRLSNDYPTDILDYYTQITNNPYMPQQTSVKKTLGGSLHSY